MRERLFRAWNKEMKQMSEPFGIGQGNLWFQGIGVVHQVHIGSPILEIIEYTGLKDRRGKDIYEGYIVRHDHGIHPVYWDQESASFQMNLSPHTLDQERGFDPDRVEVIGNIYETPGLLEPPPSS